MTRGLFWVIIGICVLCLGLTAAVTLVRISQIQGPGTTATRVLASINDVRTWADPATLITTPAGPTQVVGEVPSGGPASFVLANIPNPATSLRVFRNGIRLQVGATNDYTLTGATLNLPQGAAGDTILVDYQF